MVRILTQPKGWFEVFVNTTNNIINVSYEVVKRIRQKVFAERMNSKT
nr:MAG TPA: hypothetical protein [Caudoviricetes sp.]